MCIFLAHVVNSALKTADLGSGLLLRKEQQHSRGGTMLKMFAKTHPAV